MELELLFSFLSSFESNEQIFNSSDISDNFHNISLIRNLNNNNEDISILSYKPNDNKKIGVGRDLLSMMDKLGAGGNESLSLSKKSTEKQINIFRRHRNSIGPTFNIIVNNNKNNNKNVTMNSMNYNLRKYYINRKKNSSSNTNNSFININKKNVEKRSNSFTESGLFLKQFYSMMNNSKFLKNKHQILKEIQNKISKENHSLKRNNSLKDLQLELKLKNENPFNRQNFENGKTKNEESESKISSHNMDFIKKIFPKINKNSEISINEEDNGGEILHEYYYDKSSVNFIKTDDSVLNKLNKDF